MMNRFLLHRRLETLRALPLHKILVCSGNMKTTSSTDTNGASLQNRCCSSLRQQPMITGSRILSLPRSKSMQIRHRHHDNRDQPDPDDTNHCDAIHIKKGQEENSSGGSSDCIPKENSAYAASSQWRTRQLQELTAKFQPDIESAGDDQDHDDDT